MNTYLYSKWLNNPADSPMEFYSELDPGRWEVRKVEVFRDGRSGYASTVKSTGNTRLAIVPIPPLADISSLAEFETRTITADEFEAVWRRATAT